METIGYGSAVALGVAIPDTLAHGLASATAAVQTKAAEMGILVALAAVGIDAAEHRISAVDVTLNVDEEIEWCPQIRLQAHESGSPAITVTTYCADEYKEIVLALVAVAGEAK